MEKIAPRESLDATGIKLRPSHPGRFLAEEVEFRGMNANSLALKLRVPSNRMTAIMQGKRGISADTALRLEHCLGIPARFWMARQAYHDLAIAERDFGAKIAQEVAVDAYAVAAE
jgi:addiction module HigA family antidote